MKKNCIFSKFLLTLFFYLILAVPIFSQRDYYIYGKIIDEKDQPISKVEIQIRELKTSRSHKFITNKKGTFKFAGLPYGTYKVTLKKKGYQTANTEWKFETKQDRMQKVKIDTIKMYSKTKVEEIKLAKKLKAKIEEAKEKIQKKDFEGAIKTLKEILQEKPDEINTLYLLGICYINKNMLEEAIEPLTNVTEKNPSFPGGHLQLGVCYQRKKEPDKALESYKEVLELDPKNLIATYNAGLIFYEKNKFEEAADYFEKSLKLKPDDPGILEITGISLIHLENYKKALNYLENARSQTKNQEKIKYLDELINDLKKQKYK